MGLSCGVACIKYLLFAFNLLCAVSEKSGNLIHIFQNIYIELCQTKIIFGYKRFSQLSYITSEYNGNGIDIFIFGLKL